MKVLFNCRAQDKGETQWVEKKKIILYALSLSKLQDIKKSFELEVVQEFDICLRF